MNEEIQTACDWDSVYNQGVTRDNAGASGVHAFESYFFLYNWPFSFSSYRTSLLDEWSFGLVVKTEANYCTFNCCRNWTNQNGSERVRELEFFQLTLGTGLFLSAGGLPKRSQQSALTRPLESPWYCPFEVVKDSTLASTALRSRLWTASTAEY